MTIKLSWHRTGDGEYEARTPDGEAWGTAQRLSAPSGYYNAWHVRSRRLGVDTRPGTLRECKDSIAACWERLKLVTAAEFREILVKQYDHEAGEVLGPVNGWLNRGDGAAIYRNMDFNSADLGQIKVTSFGSSRAQLETRIPPTTLPDIGNTINWRYQLEATYRGPEIGS